MRASSLFELLLSQIVVPKSLVIFVLEIARISSTSISTCSPCLKKQDGLARATYHEWVN